MSNREPNVFVRQKASFKMIRSTPPVVSQGDAAICWAASLNSWLSVTIREFGEKSGTWSGEKAQKNHYEGTPWKRELMDFKQMKSSWGDLLTNGDSATPEAISVATIDIGMETEIIDPANLDLNNLAQKLGKSCLYICYFSAVMYHAVVCYVIDTGSEDLSVMDPNPDKGLITRKLGFFKEPVRLNRKMLIGWRVD